MIQKINTRIQIFVVVAILFGVAAFALFQKEYVKYCVRLEVQRQEQISIQKTKEQVEKLASSKEDPETWKDSKEFDSWETAIVIQSVDGAFRKGEVRSAGPDKLFDTSDDIVASRVDYSAVNVGVKIGETGIDITKGFFKGVHKSLFKKKE